MKIFEKKKKDEDKREIYLCGHKVLSYRRKKVSKALKYANYKTYNDLVADIKSNLYLLPKDIDLVVGIPRSGMIPAYIIGLALNIRVCSLNEFLLGSLGTHGLTRKLNHTDEVRNILIVDDSINSGLTFDKIKDDLNPFQDKYKFYFCAVYSADKSASQKIDVALKELPQPRIFEWNYMHHYFIKDACFDMDGVLCFDPTEQENDDGEKYLQFIQNAKPLYVPNFQIGYIVTSRLEKYRKETEAWLAQHNIKYKKLFMFKGTAEERRTLGLHADFKAQIYKSLNDSFLFIESNDKQAQRIAELTRKRCICCENDKMYGDELL